MKRNHWILLLLVCVSVIPVLIFRDYTPSNELRYLSLADEALRDGNVMTFYNHGEIYADKPPLYLWIVMLGRLLFGEHVMWFLGLFSLVPAAVTVGVMNEWCREELSERRIAAAQMMLLSGGLFLGLALCLRMDMLMTMFIVLAMRSFWRIYSVDGYSRNAERERWLLPIWTFLALFTKGPVGVLVPLVSIPIFLISRRKLRTIGRYLGWRFWVVMLSLCALWWGGVYLEGGSEYLNNLLFHQTIDRAVDAFHHKEPFWYYLITIWYSLFPWSIFVIFALVAAWAQRKCYDDKSALFSVVILSTFVMMSAFSSKLAVYLLPIFPFMVYLAVAKAPARSRLLRWTVIIPEAVLTLALPAMIVCACLEQTAWLGQPLFIVGGAVMTAFAVFALVVLLRGRDLWGSVMTASLGMFATILVAGWQLPRVNNMIGYAVMCERAEEIAEQNDATNYVVCGVRRSENMDVYLGVVPEVATAEEIVEGKWSGSVLMVRNRNLTKEPLAAYLADVERVTEGDYSILLLPEAVTPEEVLTIENQ